LNNSERDRHGRTPDDFELANSQAGHDSAVSAPDDDMLDRWSLANNIYSAFSTSDHYSTRIGLHGGWGTGKTSVLNFIRNIACNKGDIVIHFSAWRAADADTFIDTLSRKMSDEIKSKKIKIPLSLKIKKFTQKLSNHITHAAETTGQVSGKMDGDISQMITASAAFTGAIAKSLEQRLHLNKETICELQRFLKNHKIIIFIDDLDRADPKIIPKTLMTLRDYLDWPGFCFVLAFDKKIINHSLLDHSTAFSIGEQSFLEKIIDISYELKNPPQKNLSNMAELLLERDCSFIPIDARTSSTQWFPDNPRSLKSIIRELSQLKNSANRHGEGELNWQAIIAHTVLRRETDDLIKAVEEDILGKGKPSLGISFDRERTNEATALLMNAMSNSGHKENSKQFNKTLNLIVKLQGLRIFQEQEDIDYEMSLGTSNPIFTKKEVANLITSWNTGNSLNCLESALYAGAALAFKSHLESSIKLIKMTLDQYKTHSRQLIDSTDKKTRATLLKTCEQTAKFLLNLAKQNDIASLKLASGELEICIKTLEITTKLSTHIDISESFLRNTERATMQYMAKNCTDKISLFYACSQFTQRTPSCEIIEHVQAMTVEAVIGDIARLFTEINGIYLITLNSTGDGHLSLLTDPTSIIYKKNNTQQLKILFHEPLSPEKQSILAKNSIDYLNLLIGRMADLNGFCKKHPDLINSCWDTVTRLEWTPEKLPEQQAMRSRLKQWTGLENLSEFK
jgi:hypothetical protein